MNPFIETVLSIARTIMSAIAIAIAVIAVVGTIVIMVLISFFMYRDRKSRIALEKMDKDTVDYGGMSAERIIEYNEILIKEDAGKGGFGRSPECAAKLIPHPTIKCRWSEHNDRPAVWRKDMNYPECRSCYVEDPYV